MTASPSGPPAMVAGGAGRHYATEAVVRLGDVLPSGEARLDAVARYLQDAASDDAVTAACPVPSSGTLVARIVVTGVKPL